MDIRISVEIPPELVSTADVRANFRGSVGRYARRELDKVVQDALTPFASINQFFQVVQKTTGAGTGGTGNAQVQYQIQNEAPTQRGAPILFALYEAGAPPHDIPGAFGIAFPFGTGGRFDGFFHPGAPAHETLKRSWEAHEGDIEQGLQATLD